MPTIRLIINGAPRRVEVDPARTLLSVLRDDLNLAGTKYGCGEGLCGACTVLVDGQAVKSCQARANALNGRRVTTIEGLEQNGELHPVQQSFVRHEAFQCGYCTPGMIMAAHGLLEKSAGPVSDEQIVRAMERNICRCGTYPRIVAAIRDAAAKRSA